MKRLKEQSVDQSINLILVNRYIRTLERITVSKIT